MPKERGAWYQRQKDREKARRAAAAALRPPKPPGINRDPERKRAYNREWMRAHSKYQPHPRPKKVPVKVVPVVPLPEACTGHPLFEEAKGHLRRWELSDFDRDMDSVARDLICEYVLAKLEGHDPLEAMKRWRTRSNNDRKALVFGLSLVDGLER